MLLDWLVQHYPLANRTTLKQMVESGRVLVNGQPARKLKQPLLAGDDVQVLDRAAHIQPPALPFPIVHEDDDILVIDKPAGLLTSTVARERRPTALAMVRQYVRSRQPRARVGLIHRLDRDASGLLIFSKNDVAYRSLKRQFFEHTVDRVYMAIVSGVPNPRRGRIRSRLVELPDGSVKSSRAPGKGEQAVSDYEVVQYDGKTAAVRVTLLTGRKHQIRVQLSERGTPVVGDPVYAMATTKSRLMLAAVELGIVHPRSGRAMRFTVALPPEMADACRAMRRGS